MGAHWKREVVQDHKFDFINVDDFIDNSCWRQFTYSLVFAAIIRGILVYCSDIFTAANLLANSDENSFVTRQGVELEVFGKLPFEVYKYLFTGCILLGFILLGLEIRRARAIIASRDISYAFTSLIASRYYTVRSYPHYCLFAQINNSKKTVDEVAFFCFFTFRNWKRLMLADAPRQVINATILYQTFRHHEFNFKKGGMFDWDAVVGPEDRFIFKKITLGAMIFTVFMFAMSLLMLLSAVILYIPLVSHIQGNLKEYCCHKIDKRIDELIRKKSRSRAADEAGKAGKDITLVNLKQPTLPQVDIFDTPVAPAQTPRIQHAQNTPMTHYPPTPKSAYSYVQTPQQQHQEYPYSSASAYNNNISQQQQQHVHRQQQQQQQQPQQQNQRGYDYYQTKSAPVGPTTPTTSLSPKNAMDPYAESAFTTDDIYQHYAMDQDQQYLNQPYGGGGSAYPQVGGAGVSPAYYNNGRGNSSSSNVSGSNRGTSYGSQTPGRARGGYDDYGQPRPPSPIQSQHGSDLDSRHSSNHHGNNSNNNNNSHGNQMGYGYGPSTGGGAGRAGAGAGAGYSNGNSNGNLRYARNGATAFSNSGNGSGQGGWQENSGRDAYRGGGGGGGRGY